MTSEDLKIADFADGPRTVTIDFVAVEIRGVDDQRTFIHFVEGGRLRLNRALATALVKMHSADLELWPGAVVTLHATTTIVLGSPRECIRIDTEAP